MELKKLYPKIKLFAKGLKDGFYLFGETVSGLTNTVLLFLVYLIMFGATALFGKLTGKNFLHEKRGWKKVNSRNKKNFYKQF